MRKVFFLCCSISLWSFAASLSADGLPGQAIFQAKCKTCHGEKGEGKEAIAKMYKVDVSALALNSTKSSDEALKTMVQNGKGKMPAFKEKLSEDEINQVLAYVKSLSQK